MEAFYLFHNLIGEPMIKGAAATIGVVAVLIMTKTIPVVEKTEKK